MQTDIDYRGLEYRWAGFDWYYRFTTCNYDSTADLVCEKWVADRNHFSIPERTALAFWFGAVGSPSSMIFTKKFGNFNKNSAKAILEFFEKNKSRISFASDARYRKINFQPFIKSVCDSLSHTDTIYEYVLDKFTQRTSAVGNQHQANYNTLSECCRNDWQQWGRMGHWCFAEALKHFTQFPIKPPTMEFGPTGKSHTSGWLLAIEKHRLKRDQILELDKPDLEIQAHSYIVRVRENFPSFYKEADYFTLETACCNYKRQHRGTRYAGCYIDELYDDLQVLKKDWPEYSELYEQYMKARWNVLPKPLLYEANKDFNPSKPAYQISWHKAFMEFGRMPRVEAWANGKPQRWCDISDLGYEANLEDMWS